MVVKTSRECDIFSCELPKSSRDEEGTHSVQNNKSLDYCRRLIYQQFLFV